MGVEANGPRKVIYRNEVLRHIHYAHVSVMRAVGKQVDDRLVRFVH